MTMRRWETRSQMFELAAFARLAVEARMPGSGEWDGEGIDYLLDRVCERIDGGHAYDCDEYRVLADLARAGRIVAASEVDPNPRPARSE